MISKEESPATSLPLLATPTAIDWERLGWVLLGVFFVGSLAVMVGMPWQTGDFDAYHHAAVRVSEGESPYVLDEFGIWYAYRYSPGFAYVMTPLAYLDVGWAGRVWFVINWLVLGGCMWLAASLVLGSRPWPAEAGKVILLALYACGCYNCHNIFQGQVSLLMILLCLGWAVCQRGGRNFTGGMLLAAACALKLCPVILTPYLVVRKDWRGLAGLVVGTAICVLIPAPWVGLQGTLDLHTDWMAHARLTQAPWQNYRVGNQGFVGMISRLPHISNGVVCYSDANMENLERTYPLLAIGLAGALYAWILWDLRGRRQLPAGEARQRDNLYLVMLLLYMTLAHPSAWRCNFVALLLPCLVLAQNYYLRRSGYALSRAALILVALAWIWPALVLGVPLLWTWTMITAETTLLDVLKAKVVDPDWRFVVWMLQGAHFWVALLVGGACWWICRPARQEAESPEPLIGRSLPIPVPATSNVSTSRV
jgi:hypothetical protein